MRSPHALSLRAMKASMPKQMGRRECERHSRTRVAIHNEGNDGMAGKDHAASAAWWASWPTSPPVKRIPTRVRVTEREAGGERSAVEMQAACSMI